MRRRLILPLLAALPWLARSDQLPIRTYTSADGLAADRVNCIHADSRGFLWFCTREGLSRFDGYRFVNYTVEDGLPHNLITALLETRSGEYFVGTGRGVSRINPSGSKSLFTTYTPELNSPDRRVTALRESRSGKIWCSTRRALYEWDRANHFRRIPIPLHSDINDILEDPQGNIWVATSREILVMGDRGVVKTFTPKVGAREDRIYSLLLDSSGRIWAAARGGVFLFVQRTGGAWSLERIYTTKSGIVGYVADALVESLDGTLWVGSEWGINLISLKGDEPKVLKQVTREQGLSDRNIACLAIDRAGNLWAGTDAGGAMRLDRLGFTTYREQDGLATDRVHSVFQDRDGELMAITVTGYLKRSIGVFDGVRFRGIGLPVFNGHASWMTDRILLQSRTGEWWVATDDGLCRFPVMKAASLDGRSPAVCYPYGVVLQIFEDSKGGIWASALSRESYRLMRWDSATNSIHDFPVPKAPGGAVNAFAEDGLGNVWLGLNRGGLYRYDGRGFRYFQAADGVPRGTIWALWADAHGLWVGSSDGGLARITNTGDDHPRVETYNVSRGLASNIVFCLTGDRQGRVYAGTGKGIDRVDPQTGHIHHFSTANGLAHGEIHSATLDSSGMLWFATTQGLSRLDPSAEQPDVTPTIFITDLRIGGASYPLSRTGEASISNLKLKPSQNQLQIEFAGFDGGLGESLVYSYQLEGADQAWSPPRMQHSVNYAGLGAGNYRFLVKAVTSDGVETVKPAQISFTVLPPVWRQWWFELLAAAFVAGLIFSAHRYRIAQITRQEQLRTAIAMDLHDDIGASLSQIAILSEVARVRGNGQSGPEDPLGRIAALARELVDSMGDIVWSIRSGPHGMDSLVRRMREFALDVLGLQGIDFDLRTPPPVEEVQLSLQSRRQLFLMFKECIHNAARHSHCSAVVAELNIVDREVVLTVADNGNGLPGAEREPGSVGGTGMVSMRARAESLGGRLEVYSKPGAGCTVTIRLPWRRGVRARAHL